MSGYNIPTRFYIVQQKKTVRESNTLVHKVRKSLLSGCAIHYELTALCLDRIKIPCALDPPQDFSKTGYLSISAGV